MEPPVVEAGTKSVMERLTQPVETVEQAAEIEEQPIVTGEQCMETEEQPMSELLPATVEVALECVSDPTASTESAAPEERELGQPEDAQKETHVHDVAASDRKNIPPKKNRMEPLKMDMSRPPKMVTPLTSSQISLQCLECHIIFSDHKSKERHLKQSHPAEYEQCMLGDALFACYVCDRHFTNSSDLMLHQRAHTEKTPFKCPICGEAFSRSSELTLHKKLHFGLYGYTCADCGKPCKTLTLLKYHRRTHTGERPYVCKECGKRFSMSKALQKHALAHLPEGMKGDVGGITPPTKAQLKNSGTAVVKLSCSVCKANFKTAKTRLHHMKHKHNLCVTAPSSTTLAGQQVKLGQPIITQVPMGQPTFLHMEPLGPLQQVDNIDTEQIRKLIESLGNVRKVNQVVILGQVLPHGQTLDLQRLQGKREHLQFRFTQPHFIELKKIGGGETKSMGLEQAKPQCESLEPIITLEPVISDGQMETPLFSHTQEVTYTEHAGLKQTHEGEMIPQQLHGQTGQTVEEENTMIQTVSVEQVFCHSETVELRETTEQSQTVVLEVTPSLLPTLELEQTQTDQQGLMSASSLPTFLFEQTSGQNLMVQEGNISVPSLIPTVELKLRPLTDQQEELSTSSLVPTVKFAQTPPGQTSQVGETATQMETLQLEQIYSSIGQTQQTGIGQRRAVEKPLLENTENDQQHILENPCEGKKQTSQEQLQTLIDKSASNNALNSRELQPCTPTSEIFPPPSETKAPQSSQLPVHLMSVQEFVKVRKRKQPNNSIMQGNMQQQTVELKGEAAKRPRAMKAHLVVKFGPKEKPKNQNKLPQPSKLLQKGDQIQDMNQMCVSALPDKNLPLKVGKEKTVKRKNNISKLKNKSPSILCDPHVQQVDEQVHQVKPRKKKVEKQKYVISETYSEQISAEPISEQEVITPPKPKKKKQQTIAQEDQLKKTKGQKMSKMGRKKNKPNVKASPKTEDIPGPEIKQQSLLLLKGHKQPQLKVYKLDASKAPQGQTDLHQDTHPIHKKTGPKSKQLKMLAAGGKRKVGRPKKNHAALSVLAPLKTTSHSSDTSPTKPKTSRKRKAQKVETEGLISGSHSPRALECKDCGERFSDVSSLQEHKAALHAVESPGLTYTNGNIFEGVSGSDLGPPPLKVTEEVIENSLSQNMFGMQVASDWDMAVEMREVGLGERGERVSFPALNTSPSLPLAAALVEGGQKEREKNMNKTSEGIESFSHMAPNSTLSYSPPQVQFTYLAKSDKVQPLLSENLSPPHLTPIAPLHSCHQTGDTKSESQSNMNDTADALIPTVSGFEHLGPIEDEIKEELLLEVDLVTVGDGDQNEGEHQSSPHKDRSQNERSSLHENSTHENNRTHALSAHAQIENVNRTVTTQNVQTESCPSDPLEIKQEEEEIMVQRREVEKRGVGRRNYTRGRRRGVGRGRRGSATRKSLEGAGMREIEPEKEIDECQVVYQLYSLNNDTEIKDEADVTTLHPGQSSPISLQTENRSISEQNMLTAPCPSGSCISPLEEDLEDQVVFELESVTTSVVEVLKTEDGMVMKGVAGDQDDRDTGQSPGIILERFLTSRQSEAAVGENGVVLMVDLRGQEVKVEENTSDLVPVPHTSHARHTVEQRGVRMYLVKQENNLVLNDPQVSQGQSQLNVEHSSTRQCIFYPVKEERELLDEPSQSEQGVPALVVPGEAKLNHPMERLSTTNPAVENEVNRRAAKLRFEINEYGEGDLDFEQQDTEELVDFLLQNSDEVESEVVECSDPHPEAVVMACFHDSQNHASLHSNYIPNNLPTTESQAHSVSMGGSQAGTGYRKPIDYFSKYFGWDAWAEIARCTNKVSHLSNAVTAKEVAQFVGIHIAMGTLKFPSLKLYWQDFTRVPLVADTMSASRFSQLSCKLQLASPAPAGDPMDTQEAGHSGNPDRPKEGDPTRNPLRALHTPANPTVVTTRVELDGSVHTLTRGHSQIQALSSKSVSAKSTTQTSTVPHSIWQRCGDMPSSQDCFSFKTDPLWRVRPLMDHVRAGCLMLRREGDHGVDQYPLPLTCRAVNNKRPSLHSTVLVRCDGLILDFNLSLDLSNKEATVEKMVPRDGMVYLCKQELSTPAMLEHLLGSGVHGAGKVGGAKGQMGDEFVSSDGRLMLHRYHLGFILSTVGKAQQNMASLVDSFEKAQKAASLNRDLLNLYHSPLSASAPTSWPQAVLWYLTDLALVNSWMQYRQDHVPLPEPLNLMAFRLEVSKALILSSGLDTQDSAPPHPTQKLHSPGTAPDPGLLQDSPLPDMATRYDGSGHWPEQLGEGEGGRCRFGGCERLSRVRCLKCCVFLCISRNHNCFLNFHSQGTF
ncbi:zinc finger protein 576, tandem duplicate 1 [Oncorhynchus kisutch]|uniref:Uncharacterized LOC109901788 n=1 Tax=Oncorhynchus kisutch TaxID=8019 RepID=A0A8C7FUF0_ONCKI|nr:uncharacterized protein LOC109901788 [Oncorhynchus kisutch]